MEKIKINILPNLFLKSDGTFDLNEAMKLCGKIAGVCYDKDGFEHINKEPEEKTMRRVNRTLNNCHHSVYDHITINFNIHNIPKILAMVLNNEHQYTTSEKSARFTPIKRTNDSIITKTEEILYNKWLNIFKIKIKKQYGYIYNDNQIEKLAQENARYLVTVFMPTEMVYSTSLRQINYIAKWMMDYINQADSNNSFENKLANCMKDFIFELLNINVIEERLCQNEKHRKISIFGKDLDKKQEYFGDIYSTIYKGSFAQYAQVHRHRTLKYQMEILKNKEYFIPPILMDDHLLVDEWLYDLDTVKDVQPQGELINIYETGIYDDFILKCKERLCSSPQLEIMLQTKETLMKYTNELRKTNNPLYDEIKKYSHGARCTFSDYNCPNDCKFISGKKLTRKI